VPDAGEWEPWPGLANGLPPAGHYWAPEERQRLDAVRGEFLASGRHPKVILKDECRARSLIYQLTAGEGRGAVTVHGMPEEAEEIQRWLARLELKLSYRGEGLPSMS
jgi:hypothetical protein